MNTKNKILVVIDGTYWLYKTSFSAVNTFIKRYSLESKLMIRSPEETDQNNLPDLLTSDNFRVCLKKTVQKKLEQLDWILKSNFKDEIDYADGVDFVFTTDDKLKTNFRKSLYPEYKAQRKLVKKSYNIFKIHQYIINIIFKELDIEKDYDYHIIHVDEAEGDDIIATIFKNLSENYMLNILFASDKDFLQLKNVHQMDLFGKEVKATVGKEEVSPEEYLMTKIIVGDGADNIQQVFPRVGQKTALKLVRDKEQLKKRLAESEDAVKQFMLNKQLISFDYIPKALSDKILAEVNTKLYENEKVNEEVDFSDFMML